MSVTMFVIVAILVPVLAAAAGYATIAATYWWVQHGTRRPALGYIRSEDAPARGRPRHFARMSFQRNA
ncbi:hypothetical protein ACWDOP_01575 [Nocardia sp. NPDC003693]